MFICGTDHVGVGASDGKDFAPPRDKGFWAGGKGAANHGVARLGTFTAMDLATNRIVWQQQWAASCSNGTLATAGGLIFVGRSDGRFTALDSDTGHRLWQFQTDAGVAASASSFEYRSKQYVTVLSAGTLIGNSQRGDSLWLFSLDGTIASLPAPPAGAATGAPTGVQLPMGPGDVAQGARLYGQFCIAAMARAVPAVPATARHSPTSDATRRLWPTPHGSAARPCPPSAAR